MKRTLILLVGSVIVGVLFGVIGCNLEVSSIPEAGRPTAPEGESGEPISDMHHTGAAVSVPTISAGLLSALNAEYAPESGGISAQAILFATEVELELYKDGDHVRNWHLTETNTIQEDSPPMFTTFLEIAAGTGYTLYAEVFNNKVSSDTPVVRGWSGEFEVRAGISTEVGITAIPHEPTVFTPADGGPTTFSIAQAPYSFHEEGWIVLTGMGGEAWLQLDFSTEPDTYARLVADPSGSADAIMLVYDDDGRMSEGVNDPPPTGWGLFPTDLGGLGGTRAGLMGPLEDEGGGDFTKYIGLALLNRDGNTANATVDVEMDILERPAPAEPYPNALPAFVEPDLEHFYSLPAGGTLTQTVFHGDDGAMVHWFELEGLDWADIDEPVEITVTASFDVLDSSHILGIRKMEIDDGTEWTWIDVPILSLMAGNTADESPPPVVYIPLDDPEFDVTILGDGSTQIEFTVSVSPTNEVEDGDPIDVDLAGLGISSRFPGNQFTVGWNAPGYIDLIVD